MLLNLWGRPVRNIVYWIPARWGLGMARFFSIVLTSTTIIVSTQIGHLLGIKRLYLIPLFIWFQPWVSGLSFTILPQIPFSILLAIGVYLGLKEKRIEASLAFGFLPLTRHEGIAILGVWLLYVLFLRDWRALFVALLPLIGFNLVFFIVKHRFAFNIYLNPTPTDRYGSGDWFHYARLFPTTVGNLILSFCVIAVVPLVKSRKKILALAPYFIYVAIHTIIYRYGLYASGGYQLFLLPLAPAFGLLASVGIEYFLSLIRRIENVQVRRFAPKTILIVAAAIVIATGFRTRPISMDSEGVALQEAARWLRSRNIDQDQVYATHVWFHYFYGTSYPDQVPPVKDMFPESVIVWDAHYSERYGLAYDQLVNSDNCWMKLVSFGKDDRVVIFQKSLDIQKCP